MNRKIPKNCGYCFYEIYDCTWCLKHDISTSNVHTCKNYRPKIIYLRCYDTLEFVDYKQYEYSDADIERDKEYHKDDKRRRFLKC